MQSNYNRETRKILGRSVTKKATTKREFDKIYTDDGVSDINTKKLEENNRMIKTCF